MNNSRCYVILVLFLASLQSCFKEETIFNMEPNSNLELPTMLKFNGKECAFDFGQKMLRYPIPNDSIINYSPFIELQDYSTVRFDSIQIWNNQICELGTVYINKEYIVSITTNDIIQQFSLIFTNLPIVQIITPNVIYDEPKMLARVVINYPELDKKPFNSLVGIEIRGASCQHYKKKSYGFELLNSMDICDIASNSIFDMRINHSWILDAMYIDAARLRNKVSFEIWNGMRPIDANEGIKPKFVELYVNIEHQGLYCFNENVNSELLQLSDNEALLYKAVAWADGATQFETYSYEVSSSEYWDGWEQKYPSPKIQLNWLPLKELRDFIINSSNEVFRSEVNRYLNIGSFIDYYIFLNLIFAMDNTGKNIFLTRIDQDSPFSIIPWDLDGSWGISWDGSKIGYESILSNNIYSRLLTTNPNDFRVDLKSRWFLLRDQSFSLPILQSMFVTSFKVLEKSDIIDVENNIWNTTVNLQEEQAYMNTWLTNRLNYLDGYFNGL